MKKTEKKKRARDGGVERRTGNLRRVLVLDLGINTAGEESTLFETDHRHLAPFLPSSALIMTDFRGTQPTMQ
jgi:hypothetical protein